MRVDLRDVSFAYEADRLVVRDVGLHIDTGEAVGLIGPNGSGKSTLLRLVSGSLQPDGGSIEVGGDDLVSLRSREIARRLAMVEQQRTLGFDFTVREVVAMGRIPHTRRWTRETHADRDAVERAMHWAEIGNLSERSIRALSGGEGQRVFLAMALAQEPSILLLDEPTTFLDLRHQLGFLSIVRDRIREGLTVLLAIHDLTLAAQTVDRIVMLREGTLIHDGSPGEVLTQENVQHVFGVRAAIGRHRETDMLYVLPAVGDER